jgi:hypothetical protein
MRTRRPRFVIVAIAILVLIALVAFGWKAFYAGPLAFARGSTVTLSGYRAANPTGVHPALVPEVRFRHRQEATPTTATARRHLASR